MSYKRYADKPAVSDEGMARISTLAHKQVELEGEVKKAEKTVKDKKAELRDVSQNQLPNLLEELDVRLHETRDGTRVTMKESLRHGIPKARKNEAHQWLEDNGHGDVLKLTVGVDLGIDRQEDMERIIEVLTEAGFGDMVFVEKKVEPSTLKSLLVELLEGGEDVPLELFGAYRVRESKVVLP